MRLTGRRGQSRPAPTISPGGASANITAVPATPQRTAPIGVFDSGVGGLTVLHELLVALPQEDFLYLGDSARFPYGDRTRGRAAHVQPADRRRPGRARREAHRRRVQLGDLERAARARRACRCGADTAST